VVEYRIERRAAAITLATARLAGARNYITWFFTGQMDSL